MVPNHARCQLRYTPREPLRFLRAQGSIDPGQMGRQADESTSRASLSSQTARRAWDDRRFTRLDVGEDLNGIVTTESALALRVLQHSGEALREDEAAGQQRDCAEKKDDGASCVWRDLHGAGEQIERRANRRDCPFLIVLRAGMGSQA